MGHSTHGQPYVYTQTKFSKQEFELKKKVGVNQILYYRVFVKKVEKGFQFSNALFFFFSLSLLISQRQRDGKKGMPFVKPLISFQEDTFHVCRYDGR